MNQEYLDEIKAEEGQALLHYEYDVILDSEDGEEFETETSELS